MADGVGTTHHVKIGDYFYLVDPGSYRRRPAPQFGARFATGDPDYNNLSFWQHWAQTCWVGGLGAETWMDDSMFDTSVGVDVTTHEVATLTRDLGPNTNRAANNWDMLGHVGSRQFIVFEDILWCVTFGDGTSTNTGSRLFKYNPAGGGGGGSWALWWNIGLPTRSVAIFNDRMYWGTTGTSLQWMNKAGAGSNVVGNFGGTTKPEGETNTPYAMASYKEFFFVSFAKKLHRMDVEHAWQVPSANTPFGDMPEVDYVIAMAKNLGMLYMISRNGHVLRTDGNRTDDLWSWDGGVLGVSLQSYDGRLFVGTREPVNAGADESQGVIYQFTGASVTELKRWGSMTRTCTPGNIRTVNRRMIYGASDLLGVTPGFGVAIYDAVEDAHSIFATNRANTTYAAGTNGVNYQVDDVIYYGGFIFCSVRGHGIFKTRIEFRDTKTTLATYDTTAAGDSPAAGNGGWLESSDFDGGTPGLPKLWKAVTVHVDLPSTAASVVLQYSIDGGITYKYIDDTLALSTVTKTGSETRYARTFYLENVRSTRMKWKVWMRTDNSTVSPFLRGVVFSYLPLPEPNWLWSMTVVISEKQSLLNGGMAYYDGLVHADDPESPRETVTDRRNALLNAFRAQGLVKYRDLDGSFWSLADRPGVLVYECQEDVIWNGVTANVPTRFLESSFRLVLMEAIEAY